MCSISQETECELELSSAVHMMSLMKPVEVLTGAVSCLEAELCLFIRSGACLQLGTAK